MYINHKDAEYLETNIVRISNFLTDEEVSIFMEECLSISEDRWMYNGDDIHEKTLDSPKLYEYKESLINRINSLLYNQHPAVGIKGYNRFLPGRHLQLHYDETPFSYNVSHGIVIYLNDDFGGGETIYPDHKIQIKPLAKSLVIHSATRDYIHGVLEVKDSPRYTITAFLKKDPSKLLMGEYPD